MPTLLSAERSHHFLDENVFAVVEKIQLKKRFHFKYCSNIPGGKVTEKMEHVCRRFKLDSPGGY